MRTNKIIYLVNAMLLCTCLTAQSPNFVVVLTDDQGWNGTSLVIKPSEPSSQSDFYETPNLETLAQNGMVFSQAYAPAAKCSPSRNSILTGISPARARFTDTGTLVNTDRPLIDGSDTAIIDPNAITIAEWLKATSLGYRTAHYGKWHLDSGGTNNSAHGFDDGDGNTNNNTGDAADGLTEQTDPKKMFELTTRGENFMTQAVTDNVPFYLQISHYAVHTRVEARPSTINYFSTKTPGSTHANVNYAAMTKDLDDAIGQIVQKVSDLNIASNTYIIIISDNGAQRNQSNNSPLNGGKDLIVEGGIRVPMIVSGPTVATAHCDEPVNGYDLFPTIAALSGGTSPLPTDLDGKDLGSLFTESAFERDGGLYFHSPHYGNNGKRPRSAIVEGRYKLIIDYERCDISLYDLETDIGEISDVAPLFPKVANRLLIQLRDFLVESNANLPTLNPAFHTGTGNDLDADGLDDTWEMENLLCYAYDGSDDPDDDGRNNETEETQMTDPLSGTVMHIKAMLQGPYNAGTAEMNQNIQALLPLTGPYLGTMVSSIPSDVVDWILVKLSDVQGQYNTIDQQELFVKKDGQIVDKNGNPNIYFEQLGQDQVHVSVHHRNHLGIMTTTPVEVTINETLYCANDNTTSTTGVVCDMAHNPANHAVSIVVDNMTDIRTITSSNYPNHDFSVNDGTLDPVAHTLTVDATPVLAGVTTSILRPDNRPRYWFGVAVNGVILAPSPAQPFIFENPLTGEYNWDWVFEATMNQGNGSDRVRLDCASAHEGGQGYHYHGNMYEYAEVIMPGLSTITDGSSLSIDDIHIGWAADGFPILYRFGPDVGGNLVLLQTSYQVKAGERPGDGITAPCGKYNGKYTNDWEYTQGLGDLDDCNGVNRSITINGETFPYFYVITDNFPQISRCFKGTPDPSFR